MRKIAFFTSCQIQGFSRARRHLKATALAGVLASLSQSNPCNRNPRLLVPYLGQCATLNQREVTGMLRIVGKYASSSKAHDSLWLAIASALARFGGQSRHGAAVAAIRTYVDNALVRDYQEMKRKKVRAETYVEVNIDRLALLADRSDWMAIVRSTGQHQGCRDALSRACVTSIGSAMYSWTFGSMTAEDFSHDISENLAEVEAKPCAGSIAAFRDAMVASTAKLQESDCKVAMARRSISVRSLQAMPLKSGCCALQAC